jgi:cytochrome c peroxidase
VALSQTRSALQALLISAAILGLATACVSLSPTPAVEPTLNPDQVQRGALLFMNPALSGDGSTSCASCHPGGGSDQRLYAGAQEVAAGSPGARKTLPLRGVWQTPPYLWDGSAASLETAIERMLEIEMRGAKLDAADSGALRAYVLSIAAYDNGRIEADGRPVEPATLSARRGFEIYHSAKCAVCHPPPTYTHRFRFDIGTGGKWSVPSLRGLSRAAPYGHDGRWKDLEAALTAILELRGVKLTSAEFYQLKAYLELL